MIKSTKNVMNNVVSDEDLLNGAMKIVYPMGLPPYDPIRQELGIGREKFHVKIQHYFFLKKLRNALKIVLRFLLKILPVLSLQMNLEIFGFITILILPEITGKQKITKTLGKDLEAVLNRSGPRRITCLEKRFTAQIRYSKQT